MAEDFARTVLKVSLAQICQNLGWNAVHTTPMEILVDILHRYLKTIAKSAHTYAEHYNRTETNLNDLALTFKEMGISLSELEEYVNNVEPVPFAHPLPKFPVERHNHLHLPKEGNREVLHRSEWIHPHMLPINASTEDDEVLASPSDMQDSKSQIEIANGFAGDGSVTADGSRPNGRRPLETSHDMNFSTPKRPRLNSDDDLRPVREVSSVTMTPAGISPVLEGRLPDACMPPRGFDDSRPNTPVTAPMSPSSPFPYPPDDTELEKDIPVIEETVKVKKPSKLKDAKKPRKENKENKKKKEPKSGTAKKGDVPKMKIQTKKSPKLKEKKGEGRGKSSPKTKAIKMKKKALKGKPSKLKSKKSEKIVEEGPLDLSKSPSKQAKKVAKGQKAKTKIPKAEKQKPGGQLASLLAKVSGIKVEKGSDVAKTPQSLVSPRSKDPPTEKGDWPEAFTEATPEHLTIDDHSESVDGHMKEPKFASVDPCISTVVRQGLNRSGSISSGSGPSSHSKSDFDGLSTVPAKIKLEPKDVYDFTDDDDDNGEGQARDDDDDDGPSKPAAPVNPISVHSPHKRRSEEKTGKIKDGKKSKSKAKDSEKKSKNKSKNKSPKYSKMDLETYSDFEMDPPKTPEVDYRDSDSLDRLPSAPVSGCANYQGMVSLPSSMPFRQLSQIPPALLPFPMLPYPGSTSPSASGSMMSPRSQMPYPKLVDLADVAISKAWHDGDFDVGGRGKEKDREKDKKKEKRDKKDKERAKTKKKKDKSKDKGSLKQSSDKEREKAKSKKEKPVKVKGKERKEEKNKDKSKKKEKGKEKKEKKVDKDKKKSKEKSAKKDKLEKVHAREDFETGSASPSSSSIPRLTFKLGSSTSAEGPKIVIKNISVDSPSCSPVPPKEPSPPPRPVTPPTPVTHSSKSHPKPQSKVQPVPPAPARTVITETVGTIIDDSGNKIWICPACTHPDDGSPMIGCDECDEWYHWVCVNIVVPPEETEEWFCSRCIAKKQSAQKRKKHRKEK